MNVKPITSKHNPAVMLARELLRSAAKRRQTGLFAIEGVKLAREFAQRGGAFEFVLATGRNIPVIEAFGDVTLYSLSDELLAYVASESAPQGVVCVCSASPPPQFAADNDVLILCGIQDPGNLGTILRTAAAFGVRDVFADGECADVYSPKTLRASMGAAFAVDVRESGDTAALVASLRAQGYATLAAALRAGRIMRPAEAFAAFPGKRALLLGSEGRGLPDELVAACDAAVRIPMRGMESLNVAVAAGILMWEMGRGRSGQWPVVSGQWPVERGVGRVCMADQSLNENGGV